MLSLNAVVAGIITVQVIGVEMAVATIIIFLQKNLVLIQNFNMRWIIKCSIVVAVIR